MGSTSIREAFEEKLAEIRAAPDSGTAWTLLYHLIAPQIRSHLFRLGARNADRREDLVHDVFVRFIKYSGWSADWTSVPAYPEFVAYVRTVTKNVHRDAFRKESHTVEVHDPHSASDAISTEVSDLEMRIALRRWLRHLTPAEKELFRLMVEIKSVSEIADRLEISYSAAATRISRLRQRLRGL